MKSILLSILSVITLFSSDESLFLKEDILNYRYTINNNNVTLSSRLKLLSYETFSINFIYTTNINFDKYNFETVETSKRQLLFYYKF